MRSKLAIHWKQYNLEEVFGLLGCTCRLRGTFNKNFITRRDGGDPEVDETFLQIFMDRDNWGILEKFWVEYPDLVDGLDASVLVLEQQLLPP